VIRDKEKLARIKSNVWLCGQQICDIEEKEDKLLNIKVHEGFECEVL
jgi:hypothetical protein